MWMKMENEVWDVKISPRSSCCEIHLPSSGEMRTRGFSGRAAAENVWWRLQSLLVLGWVLCDILLLMTNQKKSVLFLWQIKVLNVSNTLLLWYVVYSPYCLHQLLGPVSRLTNIFLLKDFSHFLWTNKTIDGYSGRCTFSSKVCSNSVLKIEYQSWWWQHHGQVLFSSYKPCLMDQNFFCQCGKTQCQLPEVPDGNFWPQWCKRY